MATSRVSGPAKGGRAGDSCALYNAMIAPLTPYPIRGVIWYQGENDAVIRRAYTYRRLFRTLIEDWRRAWGVGDFPFLFVQLACLLLFTLYPPLALWLPSFMK